MKIASHGREIVTLEDKGSDDFLSTQREVLLV